jgi:pyruvate formate lyase activating enzyme
MTSGFVFDIRRYSIHDGPGIRTAVFLKGCPLACAWCHNPESQSFRPELLLRSGRCIACSACIEACQPDAIDNRQGVERKLCTNCGKCAEVCPAEARELVGHQMSVKQVMAEIESDFVFYEQSGGGVTFSGGEPLAQPDFLLELLSACRARGLHTAVDTSGRAPWPAFEKIRPFVDLFLYDLKLMDEDDHIRWTGVPNKDILSNLWHLSESGHTMRVRIPIIPGINDDDDNLRATGAYLASLPCVPSVDLLAYHNIARSKYTGLGREYSLVDLRPPDRAAVARCAAILSGFGIDVSG